MHHPNTTKTDRNTLDTYCTLFEMDWAGEKTTENREKFLFENPVHIDEKNMTNLNWYTNWSFIDRMRQASKPYLPDLVSKIKKQVEPEDEN